jgi:hypothetical protein
MVLILFSLNDEIKLSSQIWWIMSVYSTIFCAAIYFIAGLIGLFAFKRQGIFFVLVFTFLGGVSGFVYGALVGFFFFIFLKVLAVPISMSFPLLQQSVHVYVLFIWGISIAVCIAINSIIVY